MASLHFHYGTMSSGKSGRIIDTAFSLNQTKKKVEVVKPAFDTRDSKTAVVSRTGRSTPALALKTLADYKPSAGTKFVLVDEVQFFTPSDIDALVHIADSSNVIVMCYGLMVDSNEHIFPASRRLIEVGAKLHQMETTCQINGCMKLATHHLRYDKSGRGKKVVHDGQQCAVGDDEYKSVCRHHYYKYYYGTMNKQKGR